MGIARYALLLFAAAVITAAVASCAPRRAVNELDGQLLAFLRERDNCGAYLVLKVASESPMSHT